MSPTAVAIRHVPFEDLGILEPLLRERGYTVRYVDAGVEPMGFALADARLLVVLGGPIGVGDIEDYPFLGDEIGLIRSALDRGRSVLGVCLGAQLLAAALGARVAPTGRAEIGYAPLALTPEGAESVLAPLDGAPVLHWHGDQFDIPDGALRLAETPGFPNQVFSAGPRVLGLQFHLEADPARIESWLIGHAHELATRGIAPEAIREDARRHGPELAERGRRVLAAWLDGIAQVRN